MKTKIKSNNITGNNEVEIVFPYNIKQITDDSIIVESKPIPELGRLIESSVTEICKLANIDSEDEMVKLDTIIQEAVLKASILSGIKVRFAK